MFYPIPFAGWLPCARACNSRRKHRSWRSALHAGLLVLFLLLPWHVAASDSTPMLTEPESGLNPALNPAAALTPNAADNNHDTAANNSDSTAQNPDSDISHLINAAGNTSQVPSTSMLPAELTLTGMYQQAGWLIKLVMIGLVFASVVTWTVLLVKSRQLRRAIKAQHRLLVQLAQARTLKEATILTRGLKGAVLLELAARELQYSSDALHDSEGIKERVGSALQRFEVARRREISTGTGLLATIGSTAPFVGLLGTVWGIMHSVISISSQQSTNLAVVAPGIAEALLATAVGLLAAIPAVIIYNYFARRIAVYKALLGDNSAALMRILSRDLSRGLALGSGRHHKEVA